jgi:hypothetical protein
MHQEMHCPSKPHDANPQGCHQQSCHQKRTSHVDWPNGCYKGQERGAKEWAFYMGLVYDLMGWAQVSLGIRLMKSKWKV